MASTILVTELLRTDHRGAKAEFFALYGTAAV
jgi:hypothetical protein